MQVEGGAQISDDPNDPGGLTRFGFSQRAYPDLDIRNLSERTAQDLFKKDYWDAAQCDRLPPQLAIALADCAFNQGVKTAIKLLQKALRVSEDGLMGPVTLAAAQTSDARQLNEFLGRRLLRYANGLSMYRHGWFMRVLKLKDALHE